MPMLNRGPMRNLANLVGTWRLISFEEVRTDGEVMQPYGRDPVGLLTYTDDGHMSVQIMRRHRRQLPELPYEELNADDVKDAVAGFTGFCGTYRVDCDNRIVIHHVECHLLPGSVGKDLKRSYEVDGDRLVLKPSPGRSVVWERIK